MKNIAIMLSILVLAACSNEAPQQQTGETALAESSPDTTEADTVEDPALEDPFLWLEEVEGEKALEWVEEQNDISLAYLQALPNYQPIYERNLEIYNSARVVCGV